ncbi:hypothetical protein H9Y04_19570 [Streptomyces sp. TRM66268-LWL]|uniref:Uncharacterized protein n=1 Tax=Streptomyces polyasparticus TaxID=2767826 RepID=A0ABR7SGY5_9ACTN|nr:hypothetical protein [Streptomyces polyasparticus]MBC9714756.1 hypothetical protein [Streptomyces polyasparticus]
MVGRRHRRPQHHVRDGGRLRRTAPGRRRGHRHLAGVRPGTRRPVGAAAWRGRRVVNEIAVAPDGSAYATDSFRPVVYRLADSAGEWRLERWLDVTATPIEWIDGRHNLNGITCVGGHLLTVNSSTGRLWRIDRNTRQVLQVDLGGHQLPNGDGLAYRDGLLYVVQGNINNVPGLTPQVTVIALSPDLSRGRYTSRLLAPGGFHHPSSISLARNRALVVNSQYNRWINGLLPEVLPFTLSAVPLDSAVPAA